MCNKCKIPSCTGCSYTYQNYPCPSFPPAAGPAGPQGPPGPQGVCQYNVVRINGFNNPVYNVTGTENVILCDTSLGIININLLSADNILAQNKDLAIKDAYGTAGINDILVNPFGFDVIDQAAGPTSVFAKGGVFGSISVVSNRLPNGSGGAYNII